MKLILICYFLNESRLLLFLNIDYIGIYIWFLLLIKLDILNYFLTSLNFNLFLFLRIYIRKIMIVLWLLLAHQSFIYLFLFIWFNFRVEWAQLEIKLIILSFHVFIIILRWFVKKVVTVYYVAIFFFWIICGSLYCFIHSALRWI